MSHSDKIIKIPKNFESVAETNNTFCLAFLKRKFLWSTIPPEVDNTNR